MNNALDQHPLRQPVSPTYGHPERHDPANGSLLGRQVRLQVVKRWGGSEPGSRVTPTMVRGALNHDARRRS